MPPANHDPNRLIEFLKEWLRSRKGPSQPDPNHADDDRRDQTEAQYRREQSAWLAQVKKRKRKKEKG